MAGDPLYSTVYPAARSGAAAACMASRLACPRSCGDVDHSTATCAIWWSGDTSGGATLSTPGTLPSAAAPVARVALAAGESSGVVGEYTTTTPWAAPCVGNACCTTASPSADRTPGSVTVSFACPPSPRPSTATPMRATIHTPITHQ